MRGSLGRFWLATGAALLGLVATLALGCWQLDRAAQKEAMHAELQSRSALPVMDTAAFLASAEPLAQVYRRVALRGTWLAPHTLFLDNRQMQGKAGFYVVTPLQLEASDRVVLVQRGWVPRNFVDRASLPTVNTPAGTVTVLGHIAPPVAKLYDFGGQELGPIRQNLDHERMAAQLGKPVLAVSIVQGGGAGDGLLRDWSAVGSGVEKNYGYAFQWFALSVLIVVFYVWFQIVRRFT